jgi:prepilin-type N-terminal cleavage/methylation domain-containing protein
MRIFYNVTRAFLLRRANAFTLSELLIALAVLGIITTFTLPKLFQQFEQQQFRAIHKELIASVNSLTLQGINEGSITDTNGGLGPYLLGNLNAVTTCNTNGILQGCYAGVSITGGAGSNGLGHFDQPSVILPNGAVISGLSNFAGEKLIGIDANGTKPPNEIGRDVVLFHACHLRAGCPYYGASHPGKAIGTDSLVAAQDASWGLIQLTYFNSLFTQ